MNQCLIGAFKSRRGWQSVRYAQGEFRETPGRRRTECTVPGPRQRSPGPRAEEKPRGAEGGPSQQ